MTIVAGSRTITDYNTVAGVIERSGFSITHVIHGNAFGVDKLGGQWGKRKGIPVVVINPDWYNLTPTDDLGIPPNPVTNKYNKWYDSRAGIRRNEEMAILEEQGEKQLIAILQRGLPCRGTRDMMARAKKHGLTVYWEEVDA